MRLNSSWLEVRGVGMIVDRHCTYGDVIFCELVVKVVYADFSSVAK
jgi:hypothetical protein